MTRLQSPRPSAPLARNRKLYRVGAASPEIVVSASWVGSTLVQCFPSIESDGDVALFPIGSPCSGDAYVYALSTGYEYCDLGEWEYTPSIPYNPSNQCDDPDSCEGYPPTGLCDGGCDGGASTGVDGSSDSGAMRPSQGQRMRTGGAEARPSPTSETCSAEHRLAFAAKLEPRADVVAGRA
jgi:hypothetical protein